MPQTAPPAPSWPLPPLGIRSEIHAHGFAGFPGPSRSGLVHGLHISPILHLAWVTSTDSWIQSFHIRL